MATLPGLKWLAVVTCALTLVAALPARGETPDEPLVDSQNDPQRGSPSSPQSDDSPSLPAEPGPPPVFTGATELAALDGPFGSRGSDRQG